MAVPQAQRELRVILTEQLNYSSAYRAIRVLQNRGDDSTLR